MSCAVGASGLVSSQKTGRTRTCSINPAALRSATGIQLGSVLQPDGDATVVTEIFDCTEAAQAIRDEVEDGRRWIPVMQRTLERLAELVERP